MADHIKATGRALVLDPERQKDAVEFVQRLLLEKEKYDEIIRRSFSNNKQFQNTQNQVGGHLLFFFVTIEPLFCLVFLFQGIEIDLLLSVLLGIYSLLLPSDV